HCNFYADSTASGYADACRNQYARPYQYAGGDGNLDPESRSRNANADSDDPDARARHADGDTRHADTRSGFANADRNAGRHRQPYGEQDCIFTPGSTNYGREFIILINGAPSGTIPCGGSLNLQLPPGSHTVDETTDPVFAYTQLGFTGDCAPAGSVVI